MSRNNNNLYLERVCLDRIENQQVVEYVIQVK